MLNQSYIYKLVLKMQVIVNVTLLTSCGSSHLTFHYKWYNVIMDVSWSFIKSQKNANIGCWKINVIYMYMFFIQMN